MRLRATIFSLTTVVLGLLTASCDSAIYDSAGACSVAVKFKYDYNMKFADAFANEVKSVAVYAFRRNGDFAAMAGESGDQLAKNGYVLTFRDIEPGYYDLVAWCGTGDEGSLFSLTTPATKDELFCKLQKKTKAISYIDTDPGTLYYGYLDNVYLDRYTSKSAEVKEFSLVKNTNNIRVLLQSLNQSETLTPEEFDIYITDNNAVLDWENGLSLPADISYYPWGQKQGSVEYDGGQSLLTAVVAEFTVNRLFKKTTDKTYLVVEDKNTGDVVLRIPLVDYFLLVKSNYNKQMTDQEYLDRQDDYSITFFLDNNHGWSIASGIYINGRFIVLNQGDLEN